MREDRIKQKVKERYSKIALVGSSSEGCCAPTECCNGGSDNDTQMMSPLQITENIGFCIFKVDTNNIKWSSNNFFIMPYYDTPKHKHDILGRIVYTYPSQIYRILQHMLHKYQRIVHISYY